jgi:hypothetical protein
MEDARASGEQRYLDGTLYGLPYEQRKEKGQPSVRSAATRKVKRRVKLKIRAKDCLGSLG